MKDLPVILPYQSIDSYSSHHLYSIKIVTSNEKNISRIDVFNELRRNDIGVNVHYIPIHMQPYYQDLGFRYGDFPNSEEYYESALSLPLFSSMTIKQQDEVVAVLDQSLQ